MDYNIYVQQMSTVRIRIIGRFSSLTLTFAYIESTLAKMSSHKKEVGT